MMRTGFSGTGRRALVLAALVCATAGLAGCSDDEVPQPEVGLGLVPTVPASVAETDHSGMDHSGMDHSAGGHVGAQVAADMSPECEEKFNASMMMYNPVLADELLAMDCAWPYIAVSAVGGSDDLGITEPFVGRPYAPIWETIGSAGFGTCSVSMMPDPLRVGWVQGFVYELKAEACLEMPGTVKVTVAEYATEALRDEAANGSAAAWAVAYGRGVIEVSGEGSDALVPALADLVSTGIAPVPVETTAATAPVDPAAVETVPATVPVDPAAVAP